MEQYLATSGTDSYLVRDKIRSLKQIPVTSFFGLANGLGNLLLLLVSCSFHFKRGIWTNRKQSGLDVLLIKGNLTQILTFQGDQSKVCTTIFPGLARQSKAIANLRSRASY